MRWGRCRSCKRHHNPGNSFLIGAFLLDSHSFRLLSSPCKSSDRSDTLLCCFHCKCHTRLNKPGIPSLLVKYFWRNIRNCRHNYLQTSSSEDHNPSTCCERIPHKFHTNLSKEFLSGCKYTISQCLLSLNLLLYNPSKLPDHNFFDLLHVAYSKQVLVCSCP